ncbi:hypothetical protein E2562_030864 [Oryza meyeriana var. granulata]|uniref:Uncharacterized protein n=1 Tax=Oryza meyeriana var. granulata TaxID=110450 RepID=A0A6G1F053_9ORYZ|nr:hypothetical protein E2562_030864 [Oryza meyeriana var. granulata]
MRRAGEDRGGGQGDDECGGGGGQEEEAAGCCSCLPFCSLWGSRKKRRRRRQRGRFRLRLRLSWFSWPWRKNSGKKKTTTTEAKGRKGMKSRMLLLLSSSSSSSSSSPAKKALATSVSAAAGSLLLPKVSSFADGKKQRSGSKPLPRQTVGDAAAPAKETAPPSRPEMTACRQPCPRPAAAGAGLQRAPSRRHGSFRRDGGGGSTGGLWTMATTLGVIVFFGRVTAVAFLCSCLYAARFVRAQAAGAAAAKGKGGGLVTVGDGGSGRFGERAAEERPVMVDTCTEEYKKKVVMEGLLDRGGMRLSSRFL